MNEKKYLKLIDENGTEMEYEILIAFKWTRTNKNYIVYTDNTNDEDGNLIGMLANYFKDTNLPTQPDEPTPILVIWLINDTFSGLDTLRFLQPANI